MSQSWKARGAIAGAALLAVAVVVWVALHDRPATPAAPAEGAAAVDAAVADDPSPSADPATPSATDLWHIVDGQPILRFDVIEAPDQGDLQALQQEVFAAVQAAEERLKTLYVELYTSGEKWDTAAGEWVFNHETHRRIWQETGSFRYRLETDREVLPWVDGAAPFNESGYQRAWDGARLSVLTSSQRTETGEWWFPDGPMIGDAYFPIFNSEWSWSIFGFGQARSAPPADNSQSPRPVMLSRFLRPSGKGLATLRRVHLNGEPMVEVSIGPGGSSGIIYLDPARAYAIRGEILQRGRPGSGALPVIQVYIPQLKEVAPGIHYPAVIERIFRIGETIRARDQIDEAIANQPHWPDELFQPETLNRSMAPKAGL